MSLFDPEDSGASPYPTRWAIICPNHGRVYLTHEEYDAQLSEAEHVWVCPKCGDDAAFDDETFEEAEEDDERLADSRQHDYADDEGFMIEQDEFSDPDRD